MQAIVVVAWLLAGVLLPAGACADTVVGGRIDIRVDDAGWGNVDARDIEKVLRSVADILVPSGTRASPIRIRVSHDEGCPMVLYDRGPAGEYRVLLHASQARWHMYAYEFGHELCHIVSNFDHAGEKVARRNQWFEESLCETASLYVLDRLDSQWRMAGAGPAGIKDAENLRAFVDELNARNLAQVGKVDAIESWLREREASLRGDPYQRAENDRVARAMLPLFVADPAGWQALAYMNLDRGDPEASLAGFFGHWRAAAPAESRSFVTRLADVLLGGDGLRLPTLAVAPKTPAPR